MSIEVVRAVKPELIRKCSDAGRIGGLQTFLRHGRGHMAEMGRRGGRPKAASLVEIRESRRLEQKNEERRMDTLRPDLKTLKRLWMDRQGSVLPGDIPR